MIEAMVRAAVVLCVMTVALQRAHAEVAKQAEEAPPAVSMASFGMGCYWQGKAVFDAIPGIISVRMGYMAKTNNVSGSPCQDTISERRALGWVETVNVLYDAESVNYTALLDKFFAGHLPWQRARQGMNRGEHFSSVIFFHDAAQKAVATKMMEGFRKDPPVPWKKNGEYVTYILPASTFIRARKGPAPSDYFPAYHCHGKRPDFAISARTYSRRASNDAALPADWASEVARTRETMQRNQDKRMKTERRAALGEYFKTKALQKLASDGTQGSPTQKADASQARTNVTDILLRPNVTAVLSKLNKQMSKQLSNMQKKA